MKTINNIRSFLLPLIKEAELLYDKAIFGIGAEDPSTRSELAQLAKETSNKCAQLIYQNKLKRKKQK